MTMNRIDRYIYAVTQYLPEDMREDIARELRTNIQDMLPENPDDQAVYKVLQDLGNPMELANEYYPKKRYLIGPSYYDKYLSVLKLVVGICVPVFAGLSIISWAVDPLVDFGFESLVKLFAVLIAAMFEGALQGTFWVTLVFIIMERSGVEAGYLPFPNSKWTPDDLPELPVHDNKSISRGETVFTIFCTILFTAFVYFKPHLIGLYVKADSGITVISLFNIERLQVYVPFIIVLAIIQLGLAIWKTLTGSWTMPLAISNALNNVALCIFVVVLCSNHTVFNTEFLTTIAEHIQVPLANITPWFDRSILIFIGVFIAINLWDSIMAFVKCLSRKNTKALRLS